MATSERALQFEPYGALLTLALVTMERANAHPGDSVGDARGGVLTSPRDCEDEDAERRRALRASGEFAMTCGRVRAWIGRTRCTRGKSVREDDGDGTADSRDARARRGRGDDGGGGGVHARIGRSRMCGGDERDVCVRVG